MTQPATERVRWTTADLELLPTNEISLGHKAELELSLV